MYDNGPGQEPDELRQPSASEMSEPTPVILPDPPQDSLWRRFAWHWRFQVILRLVNRVKLRGVILDVSRFPRDIKNVFYEGEYEAIECDFAARYLTAQDRVMEVGGAVGFIGLFCLVNLGIRHYTVIEPNPETAKLLQQNYALNGRTPAFLPFALGDRDGEVILEVGSTFWDNSLLGASQGGRTISVPGRRLTTVLAQLDYQPTALIFDVEGAESLLNFAEIPATVEKVLIELHPKLLRPEVMARILADFENLGFAVIAERNSVYFMARNPTGGSPAAVG